MKEFTASEKYAVAERELNMRLKVYPRWIKSGKMSLDQATHQIDVMRAIVRDYEKLSRQERLL